MSENKVYIKNVRKLKSVHVHLWLGLCSMSHIFIWNPAPSRTSTWSIFGRKEKVLITKYSPPTPTPSRRPPWTFCQRRPDRLATGRIRYRTYLRVWIGKWKTGKGTSEYTDRYILFARRWEAGYCLDRSLSSRWYPHKRITERLRKIARYSLFKIRLEQRCIH
jgi:hypothetical protein